MYARMSGAKKPPAPATSGAANGIGTDRPHVALLSDCFSYATVSTRSCMPAEMSLAATMAVEPPTDPAVCTRIIGLPTAPSASARYSSGIATPSNMSGALPMTTASMSDHVMPASSSASCAASRTSPAIDTSLRAVRWTVCPTPTTATRSPAII